MKPAALLCAAAVLALGCENPTHPSATDAALLAHSNNRDAVVRVAPPTGDPATDVASITAAVAAATPGATIAFDRGTYAIGAVAQIFVAIPGVTLEGHRQGTTIQGVFGPSGGRRFVLVGGHQTVRRLTFRDMRNPLLIGAPGSAVGGYRVEGSTFREVNIAITFRGFSDDVSVVTSNRFINVSNPFAIAGKTVHFRGNQVTAPEPAAAPFGQPFNAGFVVADPVSGICENNVLEENTIIGNADGFFLIAVGTEICRKNVIRENTFIGQRIFTDQDNGTMAWLIGLGVEENVIEENELRGSAGLGIVVEGGRNNRIVENEIRDLPGQAVTFTPFPGTAIFLDAATSGNQVKENEFRNVVQTIVDLGTGNVIEDDDHLLAAVRGLRRSGTGATAPSPKHAKLRFLREDLRH